MPLIDVFEPIGAPSSKFKRDQGSSQFPEGRGVGEGVTVGVRVGVGVFVCVGVNVGVSEGVMVGVSVGVGVLVTVGVRVGVGVKVGVGVRVPKMAIYTGDIGLNTATVATETRNTDNTVTAIIGNTHPDWRAGSPFDACSNRVAARLPSCS